MTLTERLTRALSTTDATAKELADLRFYIRHAEIHEVHNALTTALETACAEKASA